MAQVKVIGICGGSGSGKTTIVRKISEVVSDFVFIPQDNYYKSASYISNSNITAFNFDHPDAFDNALIIEHLDALKAGQGHRDAHLRLRPPPAHRGDGPRRAAQARHLRGHHDLHDKEVRDRLDLKIFVDTPDDIRFIRRLTRDIKERGRTLDSVIEQYLTVVRPGALRVHRADQAVRRHHHPRGRSQRTGPRRAGQVHQLGPSAAG